MKIVVIGAVAAGLKAAAKARRCDPQAEITVIEKGKLISYGACGLPYFVASEISDVNDLMRSPTGTLRTPDFFLNVKNIKVITQTVATSIDRQEKTVAVKNLVSGEESQLEYDKLVLATGARPIKPPLPGVELANVFQLWHPDDAQAIRTGLEQGKFKSAVIVGAGLVGMEMAEALKFWGLTVTVVEMKEHAFAAFLDPEVGGIVDNYVRDAGIGLLTSEKVTRFIGDSEVTGVETEKQSIPADLVILAIGVRPNVELAAAAGLTIGTTGAIVVDDELRTNDPAIYAGGDCVENTNIISGKKVLAPMGSTANKQGRVIGENICGGTTRFRGVLNSVVVRIQDLNVGKTGITETEAKALGLDYITVMTAGHDKPHYMEDAKAIIVKLLAHAKTHKLLGVQVLGPGEVAKRIDVVATALTLGGTVEDLFDIDLSYAPPFNSPIDQLAVTANVLINKLEGKFRGISPMEAQQLLADEKVLFLDVRDPAECKQLRLGKVKNIKYIPLGELRRRASELPENAEIVAFCKIGLRGYEAAKILEGQQFNNVKVIEGGLYSWPSGCET